MNRLWEWFARTFPNLYLALMFSAIPGVTNSKETDNDADA